MERRPKQRWTIAVILAAVGITAGVAFGLRVPMHWAWLTSVTAVTFAAYGFDKAAARLDRGRIPELTLHVLALVGGSLGAALGMVVFRHKTVKGRFRLVFLAILLAQVALIGGWLYWSFLRGGAANA